MLEEVSDTVGLRGIRNGLSPCQTKAKLGLGILLFRTSVRAWAALCWVRLLRLSISWAIHPSGHQHHSRTSLPSLARSPHLLETRLVLSCYVFLFFSDSRGICSELLFFRFLWGEGEGIEGSLPAFGDGGEKKGWCFRRPERRWWSLLLMLSGTFVLLIC